MINFNALFMKSSRRKTACLEKLKCLLCYFSQVNLTIPVVLPRYFKFISMSYIGLEKVEKLFSGGDNSPHWDGHLFAPLSAPFLPP